MNNVKLTRNFKDESWTASCGSIEFTQPFTETKTNTADLALIGLKKICPKATVDQFGITNTN